MAMLLIISINAMLPILSTNVMHPILSTMVPTTFHPESPEEAGNSLDNNT